MIDNMVSETYSEGNDGRSHSSRERDYYVDISGPDKNGHPKAHVMIRYYNQYADGTTQELDILSVEKPFVSVFKHGGYVDVSLDFRQNIDVDLRMFWTTLENYFSPSNSVSYTDEEIEQGFYYENGEKKQVYFPLIQLILSPIGKESEYQLVGINPLLPPRLSPKNTVDLDPCVLQLVFAEDYFVVVDDLDDIDTGELQREITEEIAEEEKRRGQYGRI